MSTATSSSAGGSGGTPIDGMQACIEVYTVYGQLCPPPDFEPVSRCEEIFQNAGPECQDETAVEYACFRDFVQLQDPYTVTCPIDWPQECMDLSGTSGNCVLKYGCAQLLPETCSSSPGPSGEEGCKCKRFCKERFYEARCWSSGTTSTCDCIVDSVSVGMCEGGPEPACDKTLLGSCCNNYFMLSF